MNIESQNVSLMQAVQRVTPAQTPAFMKTSPEVSATARASLIVDAIAASTNATKQRIAIAEKALGVGISLIIEKDALRHGYIYKTIDRSTGEVVRLWPREEIATALQSLNDGDARAIMSGMMLDATA